MLIVNCVFVAILHRSNVVSSHVRRLGWHFSSRIEGCEMFYLLLMKAESLLCTSHHLTVCIECLRFFFVLLSMSRFPWSDIIVVLNIFDGSLLI